MENSQEALSRQVVSEIIYNVLIENPEFWVPADLSTAYSPTLWTAVQTTLNSEFKMSPAYNYNPNLDPRQNTIQEDLKLLRALTLYGFNILVVDQDQDEDQKQNPIVTNTRTHLYYDFYHSQKNQWITIVRKTLQNPNRILYLGLYMPFTYSPLNWPFGINNKFHFPHVENR